MDPGVLLQPTDPCPEPPAEPDAFACCGSDCGEACVWTIYRHAKLLYEMEYAAWQQRNAQR